MGVGACTYTSEKERREQMEYFKQLLSGWDIKTIGGGLIIGLCSIPSWYSETFGVSQRLLFVFGVAFTADLVLGVWQAIKTRWTTPYKFHKLWYKCVSYCVVFLMIGGVKIVIEEMGSESIGAGAAITVVGYLTMTEFVSILKNLERCGLVLPYPIPHLIRAVYKRMSYEVDKNIKALEQCEKTEVYNDNDENHDN